MFSIIQAAGWPIWPLIACSILALALIIERILSLRTHKVMPAALLDEAIAASRQGVPDAQVIAQLESSSVFGEVLAGGLQALSQAPQLSGDDLRAALQQAGRQAARRLERYLPTLATVASAAPMLGLLGTVIGLIEIFGAQAPGQGGGANPIQLAHGISVALYNTAFGLIVAIPALIFWRHFRARVDDYLLAMELSSERFARHLESLRR